MIERGTGAAKISLGHGAKGQSERSGSLDTLLPKVRICLFLLSSSTTLFSGQSVTLAWNPNSETNLGGYRLYWGPASRQYSQTMDVGNVTQGTITNLQIRVRYHFAVTAYTTDGLESDYSDEVSYYVPGPAPTKATDLKVIESSPSQSQIQLPPLNSILSGTPALEISDNSSSNGLPAALPFQSNWGSLALPSVVRAPEGRRQPKIESV